MFKALNSLAVAAAITTILALPSVAQNHQNSQSAATTLSTTTAAADSIEGEYEMTNADGTPIIQDAKITRVVTHLIGTYYTSQIYIDRDDGNGPVEVLAEASVICGIGPNYVWTNARGTNGNLEERPDGVLISEVTTGPNTGRKTNSYPQ